MRTADEQSQRKDEEGHRLYEGIFTSKAWEARKEAIAARVARRIEDSRKRAIARRAAAKPRIVPMWRQRLNVHLEARRAQRRAKDAAYKAKHGVAV